MRLFKKSSLLSALYHSGVTYPVPANISYFWNFGVLAGFALVAQIITGVFLAMHYTPHVDLAFLSVEHIMRDVNYGWLMRYLHANGASFFFVIVYTHIFRGLYYGSYSYPRQLLWVSGVIILLLMILTAFMGYVLPWGQMSFWGATVITNLCSAVPFVGTDIVYWLWGGFSVDNATLNRFFSLHFLFPFIITALVGLHLIFLHEDGSGNPLGVKSTVDNIPFTPYFIVKDIVGLVVALIGFAIFLFFAPNYLGHPDNYIEANPLVTPPHIVPEWYFLPFYAVLRSIPDKLGGVVAMLCAILVLVILPFIVVSPTRSAAFRPLYKFLFWWFVLDCIILGWIGGMPIKYPYYTIGQVATVFYFMYFLVLLPLVVKLEIYFWNHKINDNK